MSNLLLSPIFYIVLAIVGSYAAGFFTDWYRQLRSRRSERRALEAEYLKKMLEEKEKIKKEYEDKINELRKMSPRDQLDWLVEHTDN